jgi:hypothetical protein
LFSASLCLHAFSQTREGQKISDVLVIGSGRSVPLPQGDWKVNRVSEINHITENSTVINYKTYFLENLKSDQFFKFYFVTAGEVTSSNPTIGAPGLRNNPWLNWDYSSIGTDIKSEFYGTSKSSFISKMSFIESSEKNKNLLLILFSDDGVYKKSGLTPDILSGKINDNFLAIDNRIISSKLLIRSVGFSNLPLANTIDKVNYEDVIASWNKKNIDNSSLSYFEKKIPPETYITFSDEPSKNANLIALNLEKLQILKSQEEKIKKENDEAKQKQQLALEAQQREQALAIAKAAEQKRLADETYAKAQSEAKRQADEAKQKEQLAIEAQQREQALVLAKAAEQKRLADEANAKAQLEAKRQADEANANAKAAAAIPAAAQPQLSKAEQLAQLQLQIAALQSELQASKPSPKPNDATPTSRRALVIGNNRYTSVTALENAAEDAIAMADSLKKVNFEVTLKTDVNLKEMNAAIRNFKASIKKGDEVAFFYAGHGVQIGQSNYLLPVDITGESEDQIRDDAVVLDRVLDDFSEKKAKFTLALLDACRDNPFKKSGRSIGGGTRGLAPANTANGQMIIFSAGAGQQALDKLGPNDKDKNGLFTRVFIKEMQKSGESIDRVARNVRSQVVDMARSVNHDQVPAIYDQVIGEFYFRP